MMVKHSRGKIKPAVRPGPSSPHVFVKDVCTACGKKREHIVGSVCVSAPVRPGDPGR